MSEHLSPEHIQRYRQRALSPPELLAVTDHVAQCESCRREVSDERRIRASFASLQSGLRAAVSEASEHPHYEQIADYVDGKLNEAEREKVEKHLNTCPSCVGDASDLRAFRAMMSTYSPKEHMPASSLSLWERILSFWSAPTRLIPLSVAGTAIIAALCVGVYNSTVDTQKPSSPTPTQTSPPLYGAARPGNEGAGGSSDTTGWQGRAALTQSHRWISFVKLWIALLLIALVLYGVIRAFRSSGTKKS
jgi:anti-sigma factor RsiW